MNENTIKIDLKNRPEAPFDFPHRCFELSLRLRSALAVLTTGPEPWEKKDPKACTRVVGLHALRPLEREAKALLAPGKGSPYDAALQVILEPHHASWKQDQHGIRDFWPEYGTWLDDPVTTTNDLDQVDLVKLQAAVGRFVTRIENMGLYFLRMMQAVNGKNLPPEIEIEVPQAPQAWQKIADWVD